MKKILAAIFCFLVAAAFVPPPIAPQVINGTFTPTFAPATLGDFAMTCTCTGTYSKMGPFIYVTLSIAGTPTFTTASGQINIGGLPFSPNSSNQNLNVVNVSGFPTWPASTTTISGRLGLGTLFTIQSLRTNTSTQTWQTTTMTSGTAIAAVFSGVYQTAQ